MRSKFLTFRGALYHIQRGGAICDARNQLWLRKRGHEMLGGIPLRYFNLLLMILMMIMSDDNTSQFFCKIPLLLLCFNFVNNEITEGRYDGYHITYPERIDGRRARRDLTTSEEVR